MDVEGRWTGEKPNIDPAAELLLKGDPQLRSKSTLFQHWPILACTGMGSAAVFLRNYMLKRPMYAGIQRHIMYPLIGLGIGLLARNVMRTWQGEKDLMYYHYMCLHPEDFPPPERVKYRDYLRPWLPIR